MAYLQKQRDILNDYIDTIQTIEDAVPLLKQMYGGDIDALRMICHQHMNQLDEQKTRSIFYEIMPLKSILPTDIIQHCLSFNAVKDTDYVCKTFKECSDRNKIVRERERLLAVNEYKFKFEPSVKYNASKNQTWIVRKGGRLTEEEMKKGYLLKADFVDAIRECQSGDILRVEGRHLADGVKAIKKDIQIIGIGNCKLRTRRSFELCKFIDSHAYLENLDIDIKNNACYGISAKNSSLWLKNCRFTFGLSGVQVDFGCNFHAISCDFHMTAGINPSIRLSPFCRSVDIVDCKFRGDSLCNSSIIISEDDEVVDAQNHIPLSLNFIGNVFTGNRMFPILARIKKRSLPLALFFLKCVTLKHNVSTGSNANKVGLDVQD